MIENLFDDDFLNKCKEITEKYDKICGKWSFADQLNHIHDEVSEVSDVIRNKKDKYGIKGTAQYDLKLMDEVADVFLTTISLVNILGLSNTSLNYAIWKKLEVVEKRVKDLADTSDKSSRKKKFIVKKAILLPKFSYECTFKKYPSEKQFAVLNEKFEKKMQKEVLKFVAMIGDYVEKNGQKYGLELESISFGLLTPKEHKIAEKISERLSKK